MKTNSTIFSMTGRERGTLAVISMLAGTGLAYQVILTRLFSVIFQYHYVFLIVSVSIAGMSIGAALAAWSRRTSKSPHSWMTLSRVALALAILFVTLAVMLALVRSSSLIVLTVLVTLLPCTAIGFLNAALFARFASQAGILYAADLLGGAMGLGLALAVVGWIGAFDAIILIAIVAAIISCLLAWIGNLQPLLLRTIGILAIFALGFGLNTATDILKFSPGALTDAPPDKTLMQILQSDPSARITETRWDPFARLDLVQSGNDQVRYVFTDAGAGSLMIGYDGNDETVQWLRDDVEYLPFTIAPESTRKVLILGVGAGRDVLMAKLAGAQSVDAVEINPSLIDLTRNWATYNGGVLDLPGVRTIALDGRNFVERSTDHYDLIYANVVYSQAAAPGHSALSESYIFTREALQTYWDRLTENGRMGFATHQGIEGLRLTIAALDMLTHQGMTILQALQHVALASLRAGDVQTRTSVVIISRQPWTTEAARAFAAEAHQRNTGVLYLPTYQEVGFETLAQGLVTLDGYIATNSQFNFVPTTDDSPFFYQFAPGLPPGMADLLLISVVLVTVYLCWLIFFFVRRDGQQGQRARLSPYFALLGMAYLLVEIPLIQRFNLLLGQPALALVVVTGALLLGSGLGSLLSSRFALARLPSLVTIIGGAIALSVLLSLVVYPALVRWALPFDLPVRLVVTVLAIAPLGVLMGIPFPSGLRLAHEVDPNGVAALWGANAASSVLGGTLAMVLAVSAGFSAALVAGAAIYAVTAVLVDRTWPKLLT